MGRKYAALILLLLLTLALSGCGLQVEDYPEGETYHAGGGEIREAFSGMEISWMDGEVEIGYYDGDTVVLSETLPDVHTEGALLRWRVDGGVLQIRYAAPGLRLMSAMNKKLTVTLPAGMRPENVSVITQSAEIAADHLNAGKASFNSDSGGIRGMAAADSLNAYTASGIIHLTLQGEHASLYSESGSVSAVADGVGSFSAGTVSGDLQLLSRKLRKGSLSSTSGMITVVGAAAEDTMWISNNSGGVRVVPRKNDGITADLVTINGRVIAGDTLNLKKSGQFLFGDGKSMLKVVTTSGDIFVRPQD